MLVAEVSAVAASEVEVSVADLAAEALVEVAQAADFNFVTT